MRGGAVRLQASPPASQGDPGLALERGLLFEAQGQSDRAVDFYRRALEERPDDANLLLRLGAAQVAAGQIDEAEQTLEQVQRQVSNSAEAEHFVGRVSFARGSYEEALRHFQRAVQLDPSRGEYWAYAAWAALETGRLGEALERANTAIQRDASLGDAYWIRGVVRLRTGAVRDALTDLERAIELRPARVEALASMGECYDQLRQLPAAISAYERAVGARDDAGEWWYRLGRLRLDSGRRADAAGALQRAALLGEAESPRPSWLADAHRVLGDAMRLGSERAGAIEHYRRYLELAPPTAIDREDVERQLASLGSPVP